MKFIMLAILTLLVSCGKDRRTCRTKEQMTVTCQAQNTPNYGYQYATEMCKRTYSTNTCY
jgi:hypothetical protein